MQGRRASKPHMCRPSSAGGGGTRTSMWMRHFLWRPSPGRFFSNWSIAWEVMSFTLCTVPVRPLMMPLLCALGSPQAGAAVWPSSRLVLPDAQLTAQSWYVSTKAVTQTCSTSLCRHTCCCCCCRRCRRAPAGVVMAGTAHLGDRLRVLLGRGVVHLQPQVVVLLLLKVLDRQADTPDLVVGVQHVVVEQDQAERLHASALVLSLEPDVSAEQGTAAAERPSTAGTRALARHRRAGAGMRAASAGLVARRGLVALTECPCRAQSGLHVSWAQTWPCHLTGKSRKH